MAALAFVVFFVSGSVALNQFDFASRIRPQLVARILIGRLLWISLPVAVLLIAMLWAPNCDIIRGLVFVPLFPVVTCIFAVSIALVLVAYRRSVLWLIVIGLLIAVAGVVYDLGFHPQFYSYNHVFGGVLGPIYDEELAVRPGLFWFRGLTILWAALLMGVASMKITQRPAVSRRAAKLVIVAGVTIGVVYGFSSPLGINTSESFLRSAFSGHLKTEHFDIYYDAASLSEPELRQWEIEHEYRYDQLASQLNDSVSARIQSYLYPDADTRARLTGTRFTSIAPVWLATPQIHILASQTDGVFSHELVHVFSREFGMPVLRLSPVAGLIEGLAVSLEAPGGAVRSNDRVAASVLFDVQEPEQLAESVAGTLSPFGFWTGRAGVSYEVSGAFVHWLISEYGVARFKQVYASGDFVDVYARSTTALAAEWTDFLAALPVLHVSAAFSATRRFGTPSLFEKNCPHWTPPYVRDLTLAAAQLAEGDSTGVRSVYVALQAHPQAGTLADKGMSRLALADGRVESVVRKYEGLSSDSLSIADRLLFADALSLIGRSSAASRAFLSLRNSYPVYAPNARASLELRSRSTGDSSLVKVLVSIASDSTKARDIGALQELNSELVESGVLNVARLYWASRFERAAGNEIAAASLAVQTAVFARDLAAKELSEETRRTLVFRAARFAFMAGDVDAAFLYGSAALAAATRVGDGSAETLINDFLSKVTWTNQYYDPEYYDIGSDGSTGLNTTR